MKKLVSTALVILIGFQLVYAQDSKLEKKIDKAEAYLNSGDYTKADKLLNKILGDYPSSGKTWDLLSKTHLMQYYEAKNSKDSFGSFTITTKTKDGEPVKNDSLANMLAEMINSRSPEKLALSKAKYTMRKATMHSNEAFMSSIYIRNYMVDEVKDTGVAEKAWVFFDEAEKEFQKKNFNEAAGLYQKALDVEPQFYQASLYLGDSYYHLQYYLQAADKFKEAINKFPNELEPRKYLMDAYLEEGLYDKAWIEGIGALEVYPDLVISAKLRNIAYYRGKKLNLQWTPREVLPNRIPTFNSALGAYSEETPEPSEPWSIYVSSMDKVKNDCSPSGIITDSEVTDQRYLELYGWEEMLANSDSPILDEARRMQKLGYLDCYVLISCFHIDFYEQYQDFVSANPEKAASYFNSILDRE